MMVWFIKCVMGERAQGVLRGKRMNVTFCGGKGWVGGCGYDYY